MNYVIYPAIMIVTLTITFIYDNIIQKRIVSSVNIEYRNKLIGFRYNYSSNKSLFIFIILSIIISVYSASLGDNWSRDRRVYDEIFNIIIIKPDNINEFANAYKNLNNQYGEELGLGYLLLNSIIKIFFNNSDWLYFVNTFIFSLISLYVLSKLKTTYKYTIFVLFFFISPFIYYNLYLLRQATAVAFSSLAILYLMRNKNTKFFICTFIAFLFHGTAAILLFYFICTRLKTKNLRKYLLIGIIFVVFLFNILINILIPMLSSSNYLMRYSNYILNNISFDGNITMGIRGVPYYILFVFALIKKDILIKKNNNYKFFIISLCFCSLSYVLSIYIYMLHRIAWYFMLQTIIFIPVLADTIKFKGLKLIFFSILIILFLIIDFRTTVTVLGR